MIILHSGPVKPSPASPGCPSAKAAALVVPRNCRAAGELWGSCTRAANSAGARGVQPRWCGCDRAETSVIPGFLQLASQAVTAAGQLQHWHGNAHPGLLALLLPRVNPGVKVTGLCQGKQQENPHPEELYYSTCCPLANPHKRLLMIFKKYFFTVLH